MTKADGTIVLHYGPMGINTMLAAQKLLGKGAVIDANVARMAGASFAFGMPDTLDTLRGKLVADALLTVKDTYPDLDDDAQRWLAVGEQGTSSLTLFHHLAKLPLPHNRAEPHDLDDFGRCKRMLEQVPSLRPHLGNAADLSPAWGRIVGIWDALCTTLDAEAASGKKEAPKASQMLKDALKG